MIQAFWGLITCWPVGFLPGVGQTCLLLLSSILRIAVRGMSTPPLAIAP